MLVTSSCRMSQRVVIAAAGLLAGDVEGDLPCLHSPKFFGTIWGDPLQVVTMRFLLLLALLLLPFASEGRIPRSSAARHEFARTHACPSTHQKRLPCPGYVIDHVKPLACGGADKPSNMQWQTVRAGKAKDKWERKGCQRRKP